MSEVLKPCLSVYHLNNIAGTTGFSELLQQGRWVEGVLQQFIWFVLKPTLGIGYNTVFPDGGCSEKTMPSIRHTSYMVMEPSNIKSLFFTET